MGRTRWILLLCLSLTPATLPAADEEDRAEDERLLRAADFPVDGPALVEAFRVRTPTPAILSHANTLIRQLGSEEFTEREKASADLLTLGPCVRPLLRAAEHDADPEVAHRAADALCWLERPDEPACLAAAVRLLAQHRPEGAVAVLVGYLPFVEEETLADEIALALARLGVRPGTGPSDPLLAEALTAPHPLSRAVAAEALVRGGDTGQRAGVHKLLQGADPAVRERVALALFEARDREAVPALIRLLGELPRARRYRIEAALYAVAAEKAPPPVVGEDAAARRKRLDGWEDWWRMHGATVEMPQGEPAGRLLGHRLVILLGLRGIANGCVVEYDAAGQELWRIEGLRYPIDAQVLGPDRVLIVEHSGRSVTERNLRGEILWSKTLSGFVVGARRLPNGHTFIVMRTQLLDVDREGHEEVLLSRPGDIAAAVRLRNRQLVVLTIGGECVRYDAAGHELSSFSVGGAVLPICNGFEVLPNGNVLLPLYTSVKVVEFDPTGHLVWEAAVRSPSSVQRLPNGNTLIASRVTMSIVEVDRAGQQVGEQRTESRPLKVQVR